MGERCGVVEYGEGCLGWWSRLAVVDKGCGRIRIVSCGFILPEISEPRTPEPPDV